MNKAELDKVLAEHGLWLAGKGGVRANLRYADLTSANLTSADLTYADLTSANLTYANLRYADLTSANLTSADLRYADLTSADLTSADLRYADLTSADLTYADLTSADLTYANLTSADLTYANGITTASISPVGQGRRVLTAYTRDGLPPIITGGCFSGTFAEFRAQIAEPGLPWDWSEGTAEQVVRWRRECADAADLLELAVTPVLVEVAS